MGLVIEGEPNHNGQISGPSVRRMQAARALLCATQPTLETSDFPHSMTEMFSTFVFIKYFARRRNYQPRNTNETFFSIHEQNCSRC